MIKIALDTNCFIDAVNPRSHATGAMQEILHARDSGRVRIAVSLHTLHELKGRPDAAFALAQEVEMLPHHPVGRWCDQVAKWKQIAGSWDDIGRSNAIQRDLKALAKAGTDIRDRGAYVDALCAGADVFVTSDTQLSGNGPAARIAERYGLRVLTPRALADEIRDC